METKDRYWIAGLLEGEACFTLRKGAPRKDGLRRITAQVQVNMNDRDVLERVAHILDTKCHGPYAGRGNSQPFYMVSLSGERALELIREVRPLMGERRRKRMDEIIVKHGTYFTSTA